VVKISGVAPSCSRQIDGSGFVYAPERVMTNAHVVAGVSSLTVESVDSGQLPAEVVLFDADLDVAVLAVDGLEAGPLDFDTSATERDRAAVLGFPENGPFSDEAARVRTEQQLRSPDIYGDGSHLREVISIRALVRPGNSGGPVVSLGGSVYGVVFAASVSDPDTGYALTADQVADSAQEGRAADEAVSTGECA
jgi:S1-C subfamily serine protease